LNLYKYPDSVVFSSILYESVQYRLVVAGDISFSVCVYVYVLFFLILSVYII